MLKELSQLSSSVEKNALKEAKLIFMNRSKIKKNDKKIINLFLKIYNHSSSSKYISIA